MDKIKGFKTISNNDKINYLIEFASILEEGGEKAAAIYVFEEIYEISKISLGEDHAST
jgi:hypothetical protein